jgi:mannose-6-phosphate isomerase
VARELEHPLRLLPRLDPKPWGGRGLAAFGFDLPPDEAIGEALLTAGEAVVAAGPLGGRTLGELAEAAPEALVGRLGQAATGGRPVFPLLIKLIEATSHLSIQVHPDDAAARSLEGDKLGKTEAWHVLAAEPGAELLIGLREGIDPDGFAAASRRGERVAGMLRSLPARPGTTLLIPAGTVHALGAGTLVYEVQQPSDVTYRLDDWGRVDAAGRPRPLHVEPGLDVTDPARRPLPIAPVELPAVAGRRQVLAACRYFALERLALPAGGRAEASAVGSSQALTCLQGSVEVATGGGSVALDPGGTAVVPASAGTATLAARAPAVVLRAWVPNLAEEIVAPARRMGAPDVAIAALDGGTGDLLPTSDGQAAGVPSGSGGY